MATVTQHSHHKLRTIDITYIGLFSTLMMVGANITSFAPFMVVGGVPITLQTFFATLAGLILGSRKGALACTIYMCVGLAGAPVFARFGGGIGQILSPTFGFIITFILAAFVAGLIVERSGTKKSFIVAALVATAINYLIGTNWMFFAYKLWASAPENFSYKLAWLWMIPPLPKDIILAIFAGIFAHRLQKTLKIMPIQ
ncbi:MULTISPECIES: biotin transporter BioY [Lysinibacillus]|uniref:biotin transporter BioY n=1 Tax=Lysinibacillus TaxID=400634 RepID=UPI001C8CE159|nr:MULTISPECIES: biotin transporter BioY [Lysinibacillus]MBX8946499.1 biotin transporter BioY [Lysinibacillus sp. K60]UUV24005.1 biotin transporter BioY [Lysinibacillus sp. FN11]UYB46878.1 biotin transporter BioY [Lysinibacillus capsici]WHP41146.1 biotin transporter BioY [Lysinibacillus boronitolerans]